MSVTANNTAPTTVVTEDDQGLNGRIFRVMLAVTVVAAVASGFVAPWRFTTGLLIGGMLALFSHRWLRNSAAAAIDLSVGGGVRQIQLFQFLLRYLVVGAAIYAAFEFGIASVSAMIIGLSSFVVALFVEAFREFYFAIIRREEIS